MENRGTEDEMFETFTWTIEDFSKINDVKIYSEKFFIAGCPWRILMFPKGNNVNFLSIYLDAEDTANLPVGWSRYAEFGLVLVNQVYGETMSITKATGHEFNAKDIDWGFSKFIPLTEFYDRLNGFIVNDTCVIEAKISVSNSIHENQVDQVMSPVFVEPSEHIDNPLAIEISSDPTVELVDFKGFGKIDKAYVTLLEEVCSRHPSVIECQQKRSRRFAEWAFTALGRVLHFLKTRKAKDMNEDACNHLQILWEELEPFRFDLTWLQPHVQSALGMKYYIERAAEVKNMKESVAALEMEIKTLKYYMDVAEVDLQTARKGLARAEEGFEVRDLDAELGYGP